MFKRSQTRQRSRYTRASWVLLMSGLQVRWPSQNNYSTSGNANTKRCKYQVKTNFHRNGTCKFGLTNKSRSQLRQSELIIQMFKLVRKSNLSQSRSLQTVDHSDVSSSYDPTCRYKCVILGNLRLFLESENRATSYNNNNRILVSILMMKKCQTSNKSLQN